jgi:hypothetical protein
MASGKGDEGTVQIIVKYSMLCREMGITPLSAEEMGALRRETILSFGLASQILLKKDIWKKSAAAESAGGKTKA